MTYQNQFFKDAERDFHHFSLHRNETVYCLYHQIRQIFAAVFAVGWAGGERAEFG